MMKVLLHICCAPCSVYPLGVLREDNLEVTGFFYNPNIHPADEYRKRKETLERFAAGQKLPLLTDEEYLEDAWNAFSGTSLERCTMCYALRLSKTAEEAKRGRYDAFSTTLLVSPYQKHELIRELGEKYAAKNGLSFLYRDFRTGFREGQRIAKELGLYRQKYCGCIVSFGEKGK